MKFSKVVTLMSVCLSVLIACVTGFASDYVGKVVIVNIGKDVIKEGELEVCGQKFKLGELGHGESKVIAYEVKSDSHFTVAVTFASGKAYQRELGYVTSGRDFKHLLQLKEDDALIELQ